MRARPGFRAGAAPVLWLRPTARVFALIAPLLALSGCTINPATGEQSFTVFMSPAEEREVGSREHPKILKQFGGVYGDAELANYVHRVGTSLARVSEMPDLEFKFTVLNDDQVNAFALPGGYVYITRGLLALADDEAEMAGVIVHEIGHVTARHAAERYSRAVAARIGLSLIDVLASVAGAVTGTTDFVSLGAQLYLQGYSRDQEFQADMLGIRYLARAGYDANAVTAFLGAIEDHKRLEATIQGRPEAAQRFSLLSTHPRTPERINQARRLAGAAPVPDPRTARALYLSYLDGLLFGDDPKHGVRRGREFAHPDLRVRFEAPEGYALVNGPERVVARHANGAAIVFDMVSDEKTRAVRNLASYVGREWGAELQGPVERLTVNGMEAATITGSARGRSGEFDVRLIAIRERTDRIYRFTLLTPPRVTARESVRLRRTTYSFRRLSADEATAIEAWRISVITVNPGDSAASLAQRMPFARFRIERFETLNGLARGASLTPGSRVKLVTGGGSRGPR